MNESTRKLIQELVDQELDELTTTSNVAVPRTPKIFQGSLKKNKTKRDDVSREAGFTPIEDDEEETSMNIMK